MTDAERIQRQIVTVRNDLNKRDQQKKLGKPTGLVEGDIRGGLKDLERELDVHDNLLKSQEKNATSQIQQKECEKKRNQYTEFLNQKNDLNARFNDSIQLARDQLFQDQQKSKFQDQNNVAGMSNKELLQAQKNQQAQQDEQLDKVNDKLGVIKNTGMAMNENINEQNKMLDQINLDVDQTTKEMIQTNSKMKKFIANSSSTYLYILIVVEIVALVLLIVPL